MTAALCDIGRMVKCLMTVLVACVGFAPLAEYAPAAVDRVALKEAKVWVKNDMKQLRSALSILKRVKDEKSAEKAGKALQKLYDKPAGKSTAMGDEAPPERPSGEEMTQVMEKNKRSFEKLQAEIEEQIQRIEELHIDNASLGTGIDMVTEQIAELAQ